MDPQVRLAEVTARPTPVVAARTTWQEFPETWPVLSNEVWSLLRADGITSGCPNVMLHRPGRRRSSWSRPPQRGR